MFDIPLVSIIIPAYNAQDFIAETLDSILAQTHKNSEIIVVDDGSTDNTASIVKNYGGRVAYFYMENSGGCAAPRNYGIDHCSGQFICFFDADDIMLPTRIEYQVDFLKRCGDVGLVFSDYKNFTKDNIYDESHFQTCPRLKRQLRPQEGLVLEKACEHLAEENFGIAGSFMMRRDLLASGDRFDHNLKACEDFHFYYRLARRTEVGVVNKIGMLRRFHGNNMSSNPTRMLTEGIKCYTSLRETENDSGARNMLDRYIASCWSDLSRIRANRGEYAQAFSHELMALSRDVCSARLVSSLRSFARTTAMVIGVHKSREV